MLAEVLNTLLRRILDCYEGLFVFQYSGTRFELKYGIPYSLLHKLKKFVNKYPGTSALQTANVKPRSNQFSAAKLRFSTN